MFLISSLLLVPARPARWLGIVGLAALPLAALAQTAPATLLNRLDVGVGSQPVTVVTGDLNGDGRPDLASVDVDGSSISFRLGAAGGGFTNGGTLPVPASANGPQDAVLADFDNDGDLDLAVAQYAAEEVLVYHNSGTGTFTLAHTAILNGARPIALATGDLNGDGFLDIVSADHQTNTFSRIVNLGNGTFGAVANEGAGGLPVSVAVADVTGDGAPEVLVGHFFTATVQVARNNGSGGFPFDQVSTVAIGGSGGNLAVADFDGDGDRDLISANIGGPTISIRRNNGSGVFADAGSANVVVGSGAISFSGMRAGDLDADGDLDLIGTEANTDRAYRLLNTGGLTFAANGDYAVGDQPEGLALADLDGDGALDLVTANFGFGTSTLTVRTSPPPFVLTSLSPVRNAHPAGLSPTFGFRFTAPPTVGSLSAVRVLSSQFGGSRGTSAAVVGTEGQLDLVGGPLRAGETAFVTVPAAVQDGSGQPLSNPQVYQFTTSTSGGGDVFAPRASYSVPIYCWDVAVGDVDGDGDLDLVDVVRDLFASGTEGVEVRLNDGSGTYGAPTLVPVCSSPYRVKLADMDADGDLDLVTSCFGSGNRVSICLNTGSGTFGAPTNVSAPFACYDVSAADMDADGDLDLVMAGAPGAVRLNDGSGTSFGTAITFGTDQVERLVVGDTDNDGDLDVVANSNGNTVLVYRNNGAGTIATPTTISLGGVDAEDLALADFDADGRLDVAMIIENSTQVRVYRNTGPAGSFGAAPVSFFVGNTRASRLAVADIEGDGDLDLAVSTTSFGFTDNLEVLRNNGAAAFTPDPTTVQTGGGVIGLVSGDVDGDGTADLVTADNNSSAVSVLRNPRLLDLTVSTAQAIPAGFYRNITVTGTGAATLAAPIHLHGLLLVQAGGSFDPTCQPIFGPGDLTVEAGATLATCSMYTVRITGGDANLSPDATYIYNGTDPQFTFDLPATVRDLIISNPAGVTLVEPLAIRRTLDLAADSGNFDLDGHMLTLLSGPTGTAMVVNRGAGVVLGTATVQRWVSPVFNPRVAYHHMTAPVLSTTVNDFRVTPGFTPVVNGAYNTAANPLAVRPYPNLFGFDETRGGPTAPFDRGYFSPTPVGQPTSQALTAPLTSGRGYSVYCPARTYDFVGALRAGDIAVTGLTRTGNNGKSGWHLLGNPYPSPLNWDAVFFADIPTGMSDAIAVWRPAVSGGSNGQYLTCANEAGTLPDGEVAMGQGFWVQVLNGAPAPLTFTFKDYMRIYDGYTDPRFNRAAPGAAAVSATVPAAERPRVQLSLRAATPEAEATETVVYFQDGATAARDAHHDGAQPEHNVGLPTLLTLTPEGDELSINGQPLAALATGTTLPLLLDVPAPGSYELPPTALANLSGTAVALVDRLTGTRYDLAATPRVAFRAEQAGEIRSRFALEFGARVLGTSSLAPATSHFTLWPNPATETVRLSGTAAGQTVQVLDATGRVVRRTTAADVTTFDLRGLTPGVYVVRVGEQSQRLVVR